MSDGRSVFRGNVNAEVAVRIAVGFSDTACPPCAVYAAYNEIAVSDKAICNGIGMTHSCSSRFYSEFGRWVKSSGVENEATER